MLDYVFFFRCLVELVHSIVRGEQVVEELGYFQQILAASFRDDKVLYLQSAQLSRVRKLATIHVFRIPYLAGFLQAQPDFPWSELGQDGVRRVKPEGSIFEHRDI